MKKAEDYICEWCDKTYKGGKELSDWTTSEVIKFANDLIKENIKCISITKEIKTEYETRIIFIENRLDQLFKIPKHHRGIGEWRCKILCFKNELYFIKKILENAKVFDI